MKKSVLWIVTVMCLLLFNPTSLKVYADGESDKPFIVFTTNGTYLFEKSNVEVFDNYISKDFEMFEIIDVNYKNNTATARFVKQLKRPKVSVNPNPSQISAPDRKIALYLTHNDESFVPSDGYDSVYGAGGIHDVAKEFKKQLQLLGINVLLDETLHIPHNSSAYSRSETTAKNLLKNHNPDAIFDVHRDGVGRSYYATNVNGEERSKIRIVVGQANPNKEENLDFALYLISVAEEKYPWLFADVYYAKGHYNQALLNKSLLFEMGTYLIEKELVLKSVAPLADVVNTALYNTTVDGGSGEIVIGGSETALTPTVNEHLNNISQKNKLKTIIGIVTIISVSVLIGVFVTVVIIKDKKYVYNKKILNKAKNLKSENKENC